MSNDFLGRIREQRLEGDILRVVVYEAMADEGYSFNLDGSFSREGMGGPDIRATLAAGRWNSKDDFAVAFYREATQSDRARKRVFRRHQIYGVGSETRLRDFLPDGYALLIAYGKGDLGKQELAKPKKRRSKV